MKIQKFLIFTGLLLALITVGLVGFIAYMSWRVQKVPSRVITLPGQYETPYRSIGKKEAFYYRSYDTGIIQYSLSPILTNMTTDTIHGGHVISVEYYNSTQEPFTPSGGQKEALDIGCIGRVDENGYKTVRDDPSMFNRLVRDVPNTGAAMTSLEPWKRTEIRIEIHPTCIYAGTANLEHYWKIK